MELHDRLLRHNTLRIVISTMKVLEHLFFIKFSNSNFYSETLKFNVDERFLNYDAIIVLGFFECLTSLF